MIALGSFLQAVGGLLHWSITIYIWVLIARCILSFVNPDPRNPIVQFITEATEPLLVRIRSKIPPMGMLDLSALVALIGLHFIDTFLSTTLIRYGAQLSQSAVPAVGM